MLDLFTSAEEAAPKPWPPKGWHCLPTGRWCTTVLSHGGMLALHAWVEGEWAITRGTNTDILKRDPFVIGSREEGQPKGTDIEEAMQLAEAAAAVIVERERKECQKQ